MVFALAARYNSALNVSKQCFFDNITYSNMYSKSRAVAACPIISQSNVTIALLSASGERLTAKFRPEGNCLSTHVNSFHTNVNVNIFNRQVVGNS